MSSGCRRTSEPGRARVVEVDVREQQVPDVGQLEVELAQALLEARQRRRRPAVEERGAVVGLDEVDADRALEAEEVQVERVEHAPSLARGSVHRRARPLATRKNALAASTIVPPGGRSP